jgi:hypothetical protein
MYFKNMLFQQKTARLTLIDFTIHSAVDYERLVFFESIDFFTSLTCSLNNIIDTFDKKKGMPAKLWPKSSAEIFGRRSINTQRCIFS